MHSEQQPEENAEILDPIAQAEAIFKAAFEEYKAKVTEVENDKDSTVELQNQKIEIEKKIQELNRELRDILAEIAEIERKRWQQKIDIRQAQRRKEEAEHFLNERKREAELVRTRKENFARLVDECKDADYKWTHYAMKHQWEGALTMAHHGSAILGDATGTGKTVTAIMSADMVKAKKVLVITPNDVVSDFFDAFVMFAPHRNVIPLGGANSKLKEMVKPIMTFSSEYTFVINYEAIWRNSDWITDNEWDAIYFDEAHSWKNHKGTSFTKISMLKAKHYFPMTATSILNSPADIWTSLNIIDPDSFYDRSMFLDHYCTTDNKGKWIFRMGGESAMLNKLGGRIVRRTLEECGINLPKQTVSEVLIPWMMISEKQATIMNQLNNYASIQLETGESTTIDAMIALITRQRQSVVYPAGITIKATEKDCEYNPDWTPGEIILKVPDDTPSVVLDMAVERIANQVYGNKRRAVVFSQFKGALKELQAQLEMQGLRVARYDGDTSRDERLKIKRDFIRPAKDMPARESYEYDVVLANYKTGGVGLTFTEATYMLCLDEEWNPAKNRQAWARIHRIGQTEETLVEIMRVDKSISMWIKTLNEHKYAIEQGLNQEVNMLESFKEYLDDAQIPVNQLNEVTGNIPEKQIETKDRDAQLAELRAKLLAPAKEVHKAVVTNRDDDLRALREKLLATENDTSKSEEKENSPEETSEEDEVTFDEDFLNLLKGMEENE